MCTSDHLLCCLQLNLSANRLCGVWDEWDYDMEDEVQKVFRRGTYTLDGIQALADALFDGEGGSGGTVLDEATLQDLFAPLTS